MKKSIRVVIELILLLVCLYICGSVFYMYYEVSQPEETIDYSLLTTGPTLPGAADIYPTIMVNNKLYKWGSLTSELPDDLSYYGVIIHSESTTPQSDREFSSTFDVTGYIFTSSQKNDSVYLCICTFWIEYRYVRFDLCVSDNIS